MSSAPILIVDDLIDNATLLEMSLQRAGFTDTHVITDPETVMKACDDVQPDLILLDLRMPGIDGFQILEWLRNTSGTCASVPVVVLTADVSTEARDRALRMGANDFLSKPYEATEVALRAKNLLETRRLHKQLESKNNSLEDAVRVRTRELWDAVQRIEKNDQEVRRSRAETIKRLAIAAEFRDDETANHVERMSRYSQLLASKVGVDEDQADLVRLASTMHDVGKIAIPDSIVSSAAKLSPEERLAMQKHCEIGFTILTGSRTPLLDLAATIALTHHERFDGSGYPRGVSGAEIPIEGRIAAIADVFDALTTDRVYRRRYQLTAALDLMRAARGTGFDPELLDLFFDAIDEVLAVKERYEDTAEGGAASSAGSSTR